jgi:hypothetical protein
VIDAGDPDATRAIPRRMRLDYAVAAEPEARLEADLWPAEAGWAYRLRDGAGREVLRARLERARPESDPR